MSLALPLVALATTYSTDVSTSGNAISSGDAASHAKGDAFDNSFSTYWQSNITAANCVTSVAYIGQDFGSGNAFDIRYITIRQVTAASLTTSAAVQHSDDASAWSTLAVLTLPSDTNTHDFAIASGGAHRYWRLQCNAPPASAAWAVYEIEMEYILTDTPTPTLTPTITPTSSNTPTPTVTNTPDYFVIATFSATELAGYPITVKPQANYGELSVVGGLMGLSIIVALLGALWFVRQR
jgi:hypothetical protein